MKQSKKLLLVVLVLITTQLYFSCSKRNLIQPDPIVVTPIPETKITATASAETLFYNEIVKIDVVAVNATVVTLSDGLTTQEFKVKDGGNSLSFTYVSGPLEKPTTFTIKAVNIKGEVVATEIKKVHVYSLLTSRFVYVHRYTMTENKFYKIGSPDKVTNSELSCDVWENFPTKVWQKSGPCTGALSGKETLTKWAWFNEEKRLINFGTEAAPYIQEITIDSDDKGYQEKEEKQGYVFIRHYRQI